MNHEPRTRVLVAIDEGRVRTKIELPRKEPTTMKYRDFNPDAPCLPAAAYPHLWATLLANPKPPTPTFWERITSITKRLCAALPIVVAAAFLPLADPLADQLQPLRVVFRGKDPAPKSLVWEQPRTGLRPKTLPIAEGNPYSL